MRRDRHGHRAQAAVWGPHRVRRPWLAAFLSAALVVAAAVPATGATAWTDDEPLPVILVHGFGTPRAAWGVPEEGGGGGLYRALRRAGYVEGETLFWLDEAASDTDYVRFASRRVEPVIRTALSRTGAPAVDLIGHSVGGMAVRAAASGAMSDRVRRVVTIGAPDRGMAAANTARLVAEIHRQERRRRSRHQPRNTVGLPGSSGVGVGGGETGGLPGDLGRPRDYLARRSYGIFEPLYSEFVTGERFLPRPGEPRRQRTFTGWLYREHPRMLDRLLQGGDRPLRGEAPAQLPRRGRDLSLAYYEYTAMRLAAHHHRRLIPVEETLTEDLLQDVVPHSTLKRTVIEFAVRRVLRLLRDQGYPRLMALLRGQVLSRGEEALSLDPLGPGLRALMTESMTVSLGRRPDGTPRRRELPLNLYLAAFNQSSRWRAASLVSVTGEVEAAAVVDGIEAGDMVVGRGRTGAPLRRDDQRHHLRGGVQMVHTRLPRSRRVINRVVRVLSRRFPVDRRPGYRLLTGLLGRPLLRSPLEGTVEAGAERPTYIRLPLPHSWRQGALTVRLQTAAGTSDAAQRLWSWVRALPAGAGPADRVPVMAETRSGGESTLTVERADLDAWPDGVEALLIGLRMATPQERPPLATGRLGTGSRPVSYGVTWQAAGEGGTAGGAGPAAQEPDGGPGDGAPRWEPRRVHIPGIGPVRAARDGQGAAVSGTEGPVEAGPAVEEGDAGSGTDSGEDGSPGQPPSAGETDTEVPVIDETPTDEVPLITAVYRSKETTHREEERTYHTAWEWEVDSGPVERSRDPAAVDVARHRTFADPGSHTLRARSLSNQGDVLRRLRWDVVTEEAGVEREFRAVTMREPAADVSIVGPDKWVVGRPARFEVDYRIPGRFPHAERFVVTRHPARAFRVQWERPDTFVVKAAVAVQATYRFPDGDRLTVDNTYVAEKEVEVLATTVGE